MKMKIGSILLCFALLLNVFASGYTKMENKCAVEQGIGPELLITEVLPVSQSSDDRFEYIEIYNNRENDIDLKDYKFLYPEVNISNSRVLHPGEALVCAMSFKTLEEFNKFYGSQVSSDNYLSLSLPANTLGNTSENVILAKDSGEIVCIAGYKTGDFETKKSVNYKYPETGTIMSKLSSKQAPSPGKIASGQVSNMKVSVTSVTLDKESLALEVGKTAVLKATVQPSTATNKQVTWASTNSSVASVDSNGNVTAKAAGDAVISVTTVDGNFKDYCVVKVKQVQNVPVTSVTLDKVSVTLDIGKTAVLKATVLPSNATNKKVTWSSSSSGIASVDANGIVTAKAAGDAVITVTTVDGNHKDYCVVKVNSAHTVAVTSVTLDKDSITLDIGKTAALKATVQPSNATNKKVAWSSSSPAVAAVDSNGVVTAKAAGDTVITVTTVDGNHKDYCVVKVNRAGVVHVTGITLDKTAVVLKVNASVKLNASVQPVNATNKKVIWASENTKVAVVDQNGKVTAVKEGKTNIVARTEDGNIKAKCQVTVNNDSGTVVHVQQVILDRNLLFLMKNKSETLQAIVIPLNATNKQVTWASSDPSIASVDSNGKVTAGSKPGFAIITVTSKDGGYTACCIVIVLHDNGKGWHFGWEKHNNEDEGNGKGNGKGNDNGNGNGNGNGKH